VRLFAGDRIYKILGRFGTTDEEGHEEPIEAGMLSKQIEKAQRKVEEQNFLIRKRVLEYDDVMNEQRRIVYEYRDNVLEGRDMGEAARDEIGSVIRRLVDEYTPGDYVEEWDLDGLFVALEDIFPTGLSSAQVTAENLDRADLTDRLTQDAVGLYDRREAELGDELMRALERFLLLQIIDNRWREHLYDMDYLREGIHLRGFAQIEPIVAYKNEAFELFSDLMNTIWSDFARMIFHVEVEVEGENGGAPEQYEPRPSITPGGSSTRAGQVTYTGGVGTSHPSALAEAAGGAGAAVGPDGYPVEADEPLPVVEQRRVDASEQIGRNDPCWCGSGKKFKKCHGA
jgi:preprotein translocase subunit SecA